MPEIHRRSLLKALSLVPLGALPLWAQKAAAEAGLVTGNVCLVSPETTAGPFYIDPKLIRADITEGRPGVPLGLTLQVVSEACTPLSNARVDIWHCDADGNYSGFAGQGSDTELDTRGLTFLRGTLFTGANGIVTFTTIYPGWYRSRTAHIHCMVFPDETTVLTSQIFFPDEVSSEIYLSMPPYRDRPGIPQITNANDNIARNAGDGAFAVVQTDGEGFAAALVIGVQA